VISSPFLPGSTGESALEAAGNSTASPVRCSGDVGLDQRRRGVESAPATDEFAAGPAKAGRGVSEQPVRGRRDFYSEHVVKGRRPYYCAHCRLTILMGEAHVTVAIGSASGIAGHRAHVACHAAATGRPPAE
jgi:hypothetical protein